MENPKRDQTVSPNALPHFIYGTAWKENETQRLTEQALQQGFRGIDTANQRRHYHEAAVGKAISVSIANGVLDRDDLFLQTKFTFRRGQDHRLPYDPRAPISIQVEQSFARSLQHLSVEWIDCFLLHGPTSRVGLTPDDWAAWRAMEAIHASGRARMLGISNVTHEQLECLWQGAHVRPRCVQNRCYAVRGWDHQVREFCAANDLVYQGFSLLTANRQTVASAEVGRIAARYGRTNEQIIFRFALDVGMIPLTGTTNANHMQSDLAILDFCLAAEEIRRIERLTDK
jgi:diketogulonate reductase-like aldo/keto reductase